MIATNRLAKPVRRTSTVLTASGATPALTTVGRAYPIVNYNAAGVQHAMAPKQPAQIVSAITRPAGATMKQTIMFFAVVIALGIWLERG